MTSKLQNNRTVIRKHRQPSPYNADLPIFTAARHGLLKDHAFQFAAREQIFSVHNNLSNLLSGQNFERIRVRRDASQLA